MPQTEVRIFADDNGSAPLLVWLDGLPSKVQNKCMVRIERLAELGHELRRPEADFLRDGIRELRVRQGGTHYRMFYFFHDDRAVLSHGCTKEDSVPPPEIDRAIRHRDQFIHNPGKHSYEE